MGLNLARTGTAAVVGVGSGVLESPDIAPLTFGTTSIKWSTVFEAAALVGGAALQALSPYTMPNLADGLVDGGVALVAARGTRYVMSQVGTPPAAMIAPRLGSAYALPAGIPAPSFSRAQIGSVAGVVKRRLS